MNREVIMNALMAKLTAPPLKFDFVADFAVGGQTLTNVSDTTGLKVGMPIVADGLAADTIITSIDGTTVSLSLPTFAARTATMITQGFQTAQRRLADPNEEQDMPALYLIETHEVHPGLPVRGSAEPPLVELYCDALIFTKVGADRDAVPASTLNNLIDGIEKALYPTPQTFRQTLGVNGILFCRIEGEIRKDPGHAGDLAGAVIPLKIVVAASEDNYIIVPPGGPLVWDAGGNWDAGNVWDPTALRLAA